MTMCETWEYLLSIYLYT